MAKASPTYLGLRGSKLKTAILLLVVMPAFILFGYNNGSTGGIVTLASFVETFPSINTLTTTGAVKKHNATILGIVTGCYDLGAVVGSLTCIGYSDKIGRLRTIVIGLALSIIALAIEASSYSVAQLVIGRVLVGASIGTISASVPVWQAECANAAHRGAFVIVEGLCISTGITLSEWISFGLQFATKESGNWRGTIIFPVMFPLLALPFVLMMPESPRWLAKKGRLAEARRVLATLEDVAEDSPHINKEMAEMELSLSEIKGSFKDLFTNGRERVLNRTLLACGAQMFQQFCGISALVFYTSTIFLSLGFKGDKARVLSCCLATFQTCSAIIPLFTVDRFGRRPLFLFAASGMCICMAIVAATGSSTNAAMSGTAVAFIFLYDFFYPIGFLGLTFLYATEVAPLKLRVPITAIANATQWLCQFVVAQITPPATAALDTRYYAIWAAMNFIAVPMVYFLFPETKGRNLEELDHIFENSHSFLDPVGVAKRLPRQNSVQGDVEQFNGSSSHSEKEAWNNAVIHRETLEE